MGLTACFEEFCANIQVRDGGTISARFRTITQRLNKEFWGVSSDALHSMIAGSFGRNTAIQGSNSFDMIFQMPSSAYEKLDSYKGNRQMALLQAVKNSIEKTYAPTMMKHTGQVIAIPFTDGITYEIMPAFLNQDNSYTYPNVYNGGRWRIINPIPVIQAVRDRDQECNGKLVTLCRMMRAWQRTWNAPVGGMLMDTLAYHFMSEWPGKDSSVLNYALMCRDFFRWMLSQDPDQEYWQAPGSGHCVYRKGLFHYKAKLGYDLSHEAIMYDTSDPLSESSARLIWRKIFGVEFPS